MKNRDLGTLNSCDIKMSIANNHLPALLDDD